MWLTFVAGVVFLLDRTDVNPTLSVHRFTLNIEKTLSHILYSSILLDEFHHYPQSLLCYLYKSSGDRPLGCHFLEMSGDTAPTGCAF